MEKVAWNVEGMTCSNCALTISKFLEKQGMGEVKVNPIDGSVSFTNTDKEKKFLRKGIESLGYHVKGEAGEMPVKKKFLSGHKQRFLFTLPFTAVLMLHMLHKWLPLHWLMHPWVQIGLCLPVFITGMRFFGKSAWKSLQNGMPNMNVLVTLGSLAAFVYSITGVLMGMGESYLFFETSASIITLVFLGEYLEDVSIQSTQREVKKLAKSQKVMANMIAYDEHHQEHTFPLENTQLKNGDLVLIRSGEQIPIDCKILWGEGLVNEAIITGESLPVNKKKKDFLIGGSLLEDGIIKAQVTATGNETVLSSILKMVQDAQGEKPPVQKLADKISTIFVPAVIGIAVVTFLINYFVADLAMSRSLMRSIAVLVISCPCAMGLATPAAIAVGLGRAARSGILFRNASSLESFRNIQQVVFDKTGTLTTGKFSIGAYETSIDEKEFKGLLYSMEKYSNHPIAQAIVTHWTHDTLKRWKHVEEIKGTGIRATDNDGNIYEAGSFRFLNEPAEAHDIFLLKNKTPIGWVDVQDEIRPEAAGIIKYLHGKHIKTILLSGDTPEKCKPVAAALGIEEVIAGQTPEQKLQKIASLTSIAPTAMIGDGINDAPSLAKATLGISVSDASHIAMQSADVILISKGLTNLPISLSLGKHTYRTIQQNLFWAFFYNIIAIPIAAFGFLSPTIAALSMGGSDVVLAFNSVRLFVKKLT